jgi:short-subunit dehydrogenase
VRGSQAPLALVTGGSAGIGLELAQALARRGYDVAISSRSAKVDDAVASVRALGREAYGHRGDAATFDGVESFWAFVQGLGRPVDVAALNVGIGLGGPFAETDLADDLRLIAINVSGTVHMAKRVVRHMVANGRGRILIVSSVSATLPTPFETVYGPSKAVGFSFAESLREELRSTGVTVTALLPGATDTEFHANAGMGDTKIGRMPKYDSALVAEEGLNALMDDEDHVIAADEATKQLVVDNRARSEPTKAAWMAKLTRPGSDLRPSTQETLQAVLHPRPDEH